MSDTTPARRPNGRWLPGTSPNPGGRPRSPARQALDRALGSAAWRTLFEPAPAPLRAAWVAFAESHSSDDRSGWLKPLVDALDRHDRDQLADLLLDAIEREESD